MAKKDPWPKSLRKWERVEVVWEDAYAVHEEIDSKDYAEKFVPAIRHTLGFVVRIGTQRIHICQHRDERAKDDGFDCDVVIAIPRGMVIRIERLDAK